MNKGSNLGQRQKSTLVAELNKISNQVQNMAVSGKSKNAKKNAKRRANKSNLSARGASANFGPLVRGPSEMVMSQSTSNNRTPGTIPFTFRRGERRMRSRGIGNPNSLGVTDQGTMFLKCAFAPPDFQSSSVGGVPDDYRGTSLTRKHRFVTTGTASTGNDYYIVLLPVPGIAYFTTTTVANAGIVPATIFTGVPYADFPSMFGAAAINNTDIVTKFRFVSNHIEVIPTTNSMSWGGSIQIFKVPITTTMKAGGANQFDLMAVNGLSGINGSTQSDQYSGPFIYGGYSACYSANCAFNFADTWREFPSIPQTDTPPLGDFGQITYANGIPGFDNEFQSLVIKISGIPAGITESYLLKTWACVEYQVKPDSALYEFQTFSPHDPIALSLYREIINELPVGVAFMDNETFWQRVLGIISRISGVVGMAPGPVGLIGRGVNMTSSGLLGLMS